MHDILSGKAVTGVIHMWNNTPMDWYSKKQATSETATYGTEFISCRTAFEQVIDHRNLIRYLGVPLQHITFAFGDNESQVHSASDPDAKMSKRHNILNFHFVWNIIAAKYINLLHLSSKFNFADVVSKNWNYTDVYDEILKPILHWEGPTDRMFADEPNVLEIDQILPAEEFQPMGSIEWNTIDHTHPVDNFQSETENIEISVPG